MWSTFIKLSCDNAKDIFTKSFENEVLKIENSVHLDIVF